MSLFFVGRELSVGMSLVPLFIVDENVKTGNPKISSGFIIGLQLVYSLFGDQFKFTSIHNFNVLYFLDRDTFLHFLERLISVV